MKIFISNLLKNSSWIFFEKGLKIIGLFLINAYIARYLGPNDYGYLSYLTILITFLYGMMSLGADSILIRQFSNGVSMDLVNSMIWCRFFTGLSLYIIIGFLVYIGILDKILFQHWLVIGLILVFQCIDILDLIFQSQFKTKLISLSKITVILISLAIKYMLVVFYFPLNYFIYSIAIDYVLYTSIIFSVFYYTGGRIKIDYKSKKYFHVLIESWPIMISSLMTFLYWKSDQLIIERYFGTLELGIYSSAISISNVLTIIPTVLSVYLLPYLAKVYSESKTRFNFEIKKLFLYSFIINLCVCIPISFYSEFLVKLIYGEQYIVGYKILQVYIFSNIFIFFGILESIWFIITKNNLIILYKVCIGAFIGLPLNFFLIPLFGPLIAAYITVFTTFVTDFVLILLLSPDLFKLIVNYERKTSKI